MLSSYLNIVDPNLDIVLDEPLAYNYSFPLDKFQKHAVKAINRDENVLVTAKTGSGKTLVGEYQIYHSLKKGKRIFYTTPIKSLSNQKFYDLKHMFKDNSVGILTGDIKFNPNADIIVMTTEILRNLIYKKGSVTESLGLTASLSLESLDAVIFDECHYINNKERGAVWEETMILLPKEVNLVLLSATIDSADLFASWLGELKQKTIHLISTTYRIVPLEHYVFKKDEYEKLLDAKEVFYPDAYNRWLLYLKDQEKGQKTHKQLVKNRRLGGYEDPVVAKGEQQHSFTHTLNKTIQHLYDKDLLPALFFVLSRKGCESYASKVSGALIDTSDAAKVKHIIEFHLHRYKENVQISQQYFTLISLLEKGIGFHHSGLLPLLKEIVEILFSKGLIKVLFATETFAVGLNMPTRTVVFTGLRKYDDSSDSMRLLSTDEYIQMAGRAGRRGKDTKGYVFYLPDRQPELLEDIKKMMTGSKTKLQSRMKFNYDFILKTTQSQNLSWVELVEKSYYYAQIQRTVNSISIEKTHFEKELLSISLSEEQKESCEKEIFYKEQLKITTNAARRKIQGEYESWRSKNSDKFMDPLRKIYNRFIELHKFIQDINEDLKYYNNFQITLDPYFRVLQELDFMKEDKTLTQKGINATEVNEGNALLMAELYEEKVFESLNQQDILKVLSSFMESDEKESKSFETNDSVKRVLEYGEKICKMIEKIERKYNISYDEWKLNYEYINVLEDLFSGSSVGTVCETYGIMEGNLTRFLLKLLNIVDELKNIGILNKDVLLLEKLEDVQSYDFYKIAIPESLYLHI
uniref:Helicase n=1 Tax=viral metagenome TaxID=1070528 RepID=A0A6C0IIK1_9ZZZZ